MVANLASVLAGVSQPEDMAEMRLLITADIERAKERRTAWSQGDRARRGNGGMSCNHGMAGGCRLKD